MKLDKTADCRDIVEADKSGVLYRSNFAIADAEAEELQKMISDRWNEIWYIVQSRTSNDGTSKSK